LPTSGRVELSLGIAVLNETDVKLTAFHSFFCVDIWLFYLPGEPLLWPVNRLSIEDVALFTCLICCSKLPFHQIHDKSLGKIGSYDPFLANLGIKINLLQYYPFPDLRANLSKNS
jgi:hypothetical protein